MIRSAKRRDPAAGTRTVALTPVEIEAIVESGELATGSRPVHAGASGTPTLALSPVEIDALVQGTERATGPSDLDDRPTLEIPRIARGTASQRPTTGDARGPRRARETLRADEIKLRGTEPPSRKR